MTLVSDIPFLPLRSSKIKGHITRACWAAQLAFEWKIRSLNREFGIQCREVSWSNEDIDAEKCEFRDTLIYLVEVYSDILAWQGSYVSILES